MAINNVSYLVYVSFQKTHMWLISISGERIGEQTLLVSFSIQCLMQDSKVFQYNNEFSLKTYREPIERRLKCKICGRK